MDLTISSKELSEPGSTPKPPAVRDRVEEELLDEEEEEEEEGGGGMKGVASRLPSICAGAAAAAAAAAVAAADAGWDGDLERGDLAAGVLS